MRLRLLALSALICVCVLTALYTSSTRTLALTNCSVDASIDSQEQAFLDTINDYRQQHGLSSLKLSTTLNRSAAWKSLDMANNGYVAHDDTPISRTWIQRIRDCGYTANAWIGENIAVGNGDAAATFEQWRGSPGHNDNMLGANYTTIGIGRAYNASSQYSWYWTTEFASVSDGSTPPAPGSTPSATPQPTSTPVPQPTSGPPQSQPCADLTDDGLVRVDDIIYALNRFMTVDLGADLNQSGRVDITDILMVVHAFGTTC